MDTVAAPDDHAAPPHVEASSERLAWPRPSLRSLVVVRRLILVAALLPFLHLALGAMLLLPSVRPLLSPVVADHTARLAKYTIAQTGYWSLVILVASLAITPLRRLSHWNELIGLRRMLGLVAFFYAGLHVLVWGALVDFFDLSLMVDDVLKRRYITVGMVSFVILLALAITSNRASIRRLGRRWQTLHRLVYVAAAGSVLHFWWWRSLTITEPRQFAVVLTILLALRAGWVLRAGRHPGSL